MAHQQHHHHHYYNQSPSCCSSCSCNSSCHPSHSPTTSIDPLLLQAITTHLLQSQPSDLYNQSLKTQQFHHHQQQQHHQQSQNQRQQQQTEALLQSLLRRITSLEKSLHHLSTSSHSPSPPLSLQDLAARTIQTHFRSFLARRSRILRDLKDLASIKSNLATLKSSLSDGKAHIKPEALLQKATHLLLKLDFIQSRDSMIREGKSAVGADLVRFLEFVNGLVKRQELSTKVLKKVRFVEDGEEFPSTEYHETENCDDHSILVESISRGTKGIGGFSGVYENDGGDNVELVGFRQVTDDEIYSSQVRPFPGPRIGGSFVHRGCPFEVRNDGGISYGVSGGFHGENGNLGLSAPMPVQMEPRRSGKEKIVRVVRS